MIAVFSGTGNSMHAARRLSELLGDEIFVIDDKNVLPSVEDARLIWVFPVYSWGVPPVVRNFISRCGPLKSFKEHYAVMTCGDDAGLADKMWAADIRKQGGAPVSAFTVEMPNTYVCMKGFDVDAPALEESKLANAEPHIRSVAAAISTHSRESDLARGKFAWIKTRIIYPWFCRHEMSPKPFHHTDDCVGCGMCAVNCPLENIKMKEDRPAWNDNCAFCLRCYHVCPYHAVAYGKTTRGKGQYKSLLKEVIAQNNDKFGKKVKS